jgi:hypothetical protein
MNEHYNAVLADLRSRQEALKAELRDVDAAIAGIHRILGVVPDLSDPYAAIRDVDLSPNVSPRPALQERRAPHGLATVPVGERFANISVRWGVLWFLAEYAQGYQRTGEIANALREGGYKSDAARFGNMVSAVLSAMKSRVPPEVETNEDGGYRITEHGRQVWQVIRRGSKFRAAMAPTEQSLLSVQ